MLYCTFQYSDFPVFMFELTFCAYSLKKSSVRNPKSGVMCVCVCVCVCMCVCMCVCVCVCVCVYIYPVHTTITLVIRVLYDSWCTVLSTPCTTFQQLW